MTLRRRLLSISLLTAFVCLVIWWLAYEPYDADRVFEAIPGNAVLVTVHDDLGGRWEDLTGSLLAQTIVHSAGIDTNSIVALQADPKVQQILSKLCGKRVAIAYVPSLGFAGTDGWLVASWIGAYDRPARWLASWGVVPGMELIGERARRSIWSLETGALQPGMKLSVAIVDGLLLCCLSRDEEGVRTMLESLDHISQIPSLRGAGEGTSVESLWTDNEPDRAWSLKGVALSAGLRTVKGEHIAGRVTIDYTLVPSKVPVKVANYPGLTRLLGDLPDAVAVLTAGQAKDLAAGISKDVTGSRPWSGMISDGLKQIIDETDDAAPAFIALLGGNYRGRMKSWLPPDSGPLKGLPVPVLLMGVRVGDDDDARELAEWCVDMVNSRSMLALVPDLELVGKYNVWSLESTTEFHGSWYSALNPEERFAFTLVDGWLIMASNTESLYKVVARYQRPEAIAESLSGAWSTAVKAAETSTPDAFLWSDLDKLGVTIKDTLALLNMALIGSSHPLDKQLRENYRAGMNWMETVRRFRACAFNFGSDGEEVEIRFEAGQ